MRFRKPLVWIAGIAGAIVLLIALAVLSAPLWFDSEGVKTRIVTSIANATGGNARFDRIDLRLLPFPGATVTGAAFSLPGQFELDAQSASVDLDLLALVRARIRISSVILVAPDITVQAPEPAQDPEPLSTGTTEQAVRDVFAHIAERAPDIQVIVEEGSVTLLASGRQPISFDDLELRAEANDDRIEATVSCTSNLWEHLALTMNIAEAELTGNGTLKVVGLRAHDLGTALGQTESWPIRDAVTDANVQWKMKGLADILAEGNLSAPAVSLAFGERQLDLQRPTIDVSALLRNGATEISIRHIALDYPRLDATAKLARSNAGTFALQASATDVQLSELQDAAAAIAPGVALLARTRTDIQNGTIRSLQVSSEADTLPALLRPEMYHAQLEFAELDALVPHIDTQVREARGTVSLNASKLEISNASARVGNSVLSEANVSASLGSLLSTSSGKPNAAGTEAGTQESGASAKNATSSASSGDRFGLIAKQIALSSNARLSLDLAEVLAITKQAMRDSESPRQLDDVKQLSGSADFSVSVTTESKKPEVRLEVSRLQTTVRHAKVPFAIPVRLSRGDLRYVDDAIYTQGLEGAIGASTFKNVNTRIGIDAPNRLRASNGSAQLSLDELMRWVAALPELSEQTDKIGKMTGKLSVSVEKIEGPLRVQWWCDRYLSRAHSREGRYVLDPGRINPGWWRNP